MSSHDHWLEFQGGCYHQLPSCHKCGYELCDHGICRYCIGCNACDTEESEPMTRKPSASIQASTDRRKIG